MNEQTKKTLTAEIALRFIETEGEEDIESYTSIDDEAARLLGEFDVSLLTEDGESVDDWALPLTGVVELSAIALRMGVRFHGSKKWTRVTRFKARWIGE